MTLQMMIWGHGLKNEHRTHTANDEIYDTHRTGLQTKGILRGLLPVQKGPFWGNFRGIRVLCSGEF
jgi:hypothetical protein